MLPPEASARSWDGVTSGSGVSESPASGSYPAGTLRRALLSSPTHLHVAREHQAFVDVIFERTHRKRRDTSGVENLLADLFHVMSVDVQVCSAQRVCDAVRRSLESGEVLHLHGDDYAPQD